MNRRGEIAITDERFKERGQEETEGQSTAAATEGVVKGEATAMEAEATEVAVRIGSIGGEREREREGRERERKKKDREGEKEKVKRERKKIKRREKKKREKKKR